MSPINLLSKTPKVKEGSNPVNNVVRLSGPGRITRYPNNELDKTLHRGDRVWMGLLLRHSNKRCFRERHCFQNSERDNYYSTSVMNLIKL